MVVWVEKRLSASRVEITACSFSFTFTLISLWKALIHLFSPAQMWIKWQGRLVSSDSCYPPTFTKARSRWKWSTYGHIRAGADQSTLSNLDSPKTFTQPCGWLIIFSATISFPQTKRCKSLALFPRKMVWRATFLSSSSSSLRS